MKIIGISAFFHDSAAALLQDGVIRAAAQEERFTRRKNDAAFPENALSYCLKEAAIGIDDIDYIVFYEKPVVKLHRLYSTYLHFAPEGFHTFPQAMSIWSKYQVFQQDHLLCLLQKFELKRPTKEALLFSEHHLSHAASAFFASPFAEAAVLVIDAVGEWKTTSVYVGRDRSLECIKSIPFPHSLGLLYSAFTYYLGFSVNSGEYKVMGLAPYGRPVYASLIEDKIVNVKPDGSFHLNMAYFAFCVSETIIDDRFVSLFGHPRREPGDEIRQFHCDMAASIQFVLEQTLLKIARWVRRATGLDRLCLAGGVALNCVANSKLLRSGIFDDIWFQPAAGDAGGAIGAALAGYHMFCGRPRTIPEVDLMQGCLLGPGFADEEISRRLMLLGARFTVFGEEEFTNRVANALSEGKTVGWFQGRMEFGPRALGSRSILADPRLPEMKGVLNEYVKRREPFRPFAASVLDSSASSFFSLPSRECNYMLLTGDVLEHGDNLHNGNKKQYLPAVTHVDGSCRVQTVSKESNPRYRRLLSEFMSLTDCPVLLNTSFNVRGEPIVCTPEDAFNCFMSTDLDLLAIGACVLLKTEQTIHPYQLGNHFAGEDGW
jgi:carbamoyltransferase